MNTIGVPDLLTNGRLSRAISQAQTDMARVTQELTSGEVADLVAATGGDPTRLYALERDLALNAGREDSIELASGRAEVTQNALEKVQDAVAEFGPRLAASVSIGDAASAKRVASEARSAFDQAVAALNSRYGDRSLFAGAAANSPAIDDPTAILADVAALAAAGPDAGAVLTSVDTYFANGGAFETTRFLGSATDAPSAEIADGERIDYAIRGDRSEIRNALAALALAVVSVEGPYVAATDEDRLELFGAAADRSVSSEAEIIAVRSELGVSEERLEVASVQNSAEAAFLNQARNNIVQRDQFEAATEFTTLETQLQAIFSVTARLSSLSLTSFLR